MVRTIRHESFYSHGFHSDPGNFTHIGWTCHERSFEDCMPIYNEKRDIILFLAGEVFSDADLINKLRNLNHEFNGGNASYLVHLYEELGDRFFGELNGCFSGILIDRRLEKSFLFNDRFGMHRLFVHSGKEGFFFSSEAKALLAVLPETREFDPKGLVELITCGCTLGERSLFKDIEVLPGGSLLEFENGNLVRNTRYFDRMTWEIQPRLAEREFSSRFIENLGKVVQKYSSPSMPVAMSLTGGFDSRMLMACLNPSQGSLPCYTFGSMYRETFDVKVARQVAKACGQIHRVLVLGEDFLNNLSGYLEKAVFLSDGYLGLSGAAELYVNALARQIAPVRLTGNWGSELLRAVRAFKFIAPSEGFLLPDLQEYVEEARTTFNQMNKMNRVSFAPFYQAPHQSYGRLAIERSQIVPRTPFLDNEVVGLVYQAPETIDGFALSERIICHFRSDLLKIPTDRGFLGIDGFIVKTARRAYRQSLSKAEYWIGHGAPDWLVRLSPFVRFLRLEEKLLGMHKFYHFRNWIRKNLREYVRETLLGYRGAGLQTYFPTQRLKQNIDDHLNESRNCGEEIDTMLMVALSFSLLFRAGTSEAKI